TSRTPSRCGPQRSPSSRPAPWCGSSTNRSNHRGSTARARVPPPPGRARRPPPASPPSCVCSWPCPPDAHGTVVGCRPLGGAGARRRDQGLGRREARLGFLAKSDTGPIARSRVLRAVGSGSREPHKEATVIVGVPKEVKDNEFRVALTPEGARELTSA